MPQTPTEIRPYLEELRRVLSDRRAILVAQAAHVDADRRRLLEDQIADEPEPNEEGQDDQLADELAVFDTRTRHEIEAIDRALARIAADEFGYCTRRGEVISLDRLRALPTTELCIRCAEEVEAEDRAARPAGSRTL